MPGRGGGGIIVVIIQLVGTVGSIGGFFMFWDELQNRSPWIALPSALFGFLLMIMVVGWLWSW